MPLTSTFQRRKRHTDSNVPVRLAVRLPVMARRYHLNCTPLGKASFNTVGTLQRQAKTQVPTRLT